MSFLSSLALVGLAALAIPVLLHLIQRERRRVVEFPSLMFLQRIPYKSVKRRQIRHWLLLALRLAALALIVFAFARPFFHSGGVGASTDGGPREVVVLLDRSYSMGYGDRWTRARAAATRVIDSLTNGERASLVVFATDARADVRSAADAARVRGALDAVSPGAAATRYGPALRLAQSILAASSLPRRELVLITDFQRSAWNRDDAVRLPEGTTVTPVDVGDEAVTNVAVTAVALQRSTFSGQERVAVTASIGNRGSAAKRGLSVTLDVDGRTVETQRVDVEAGAGASITFAPVTVSAPNTRGSVRIDADALPIDDRFDFVVSPARVVPVVLAGRSGADPAALFASRALAIGTSPRFDVRGVAIDGLPRGGVPAGGVLLLNDVVPSTANLVAIRTAVENGAGLIVVTGERAAWTSEAGLLPGLPGAPIDRASGRSAMLANLNVSHPIFEPFQGPRRGDFSSARFFRYRGLTVGDGAAVLARFDDGTPALAERRVGQGRVLLWTSTLDTSWSDFVLRPVFLPFLHGLVRHAGQYTEPASALTVGDVLDPATLPVPAGTARPAANQMVALTPAGQRVGISGGEARVIALDEKGFYEVRATERADPIVVAANVDPRESDPARVPPAELATSVGGAAGNGAEVTLAPEDQEKQTGIWWYLLLAAVLVLAGETVVANRYADLRNP